MVENRPGAGGALGSGRWRAAPDNYTLVVSGVASHVVAPALPRGVPYDPLRDPPTSLFGGPPAVLVVNPQVPANPWEFVTLKQNPNGIVRLAETARMARLWWRLFKQTRRVNIQHVPYKGAAGTITDVIAGHIPAA